MPGRPAPTQIARKLWEERFHDAVALFCAGSVVRGEHSAHSDLDIVVLFESVPNAWREAAVVDGWPVELFVHDIETLAYFVDKDCRGWRSSLANMLAEAIVIPQPSSLSDSLQAWARALLKNPPAASNVTLNDDRYFISDLLDDLRDSRPRSEVVAIAAALHERLGSFILKSSGRWAAAGKHLPRELTRLDPSIAETFNRAVDAVFLDSNPAPLITLTERVLHPFGGPLFDGYRSDAAASARTTPPKVWVVE
jgi:hypothetical protein